MTAIFSPRKVLLVLKKDIASSFYSPVAYIVLVLFLVSTSVWLFHIQNFFARDLASLRMYFDLFPLVLAILIPATAMRSWSEEFRQGTDELLYAFPATETDLVFGKFLAALILIILVVICTISVPISLRSFGKFDFGQIISAYLGVLLISVFYTSFSCLISSLSRNQVSAFLVSAGILSALNFIDQALIFSAVPGFLRSLIQSISIDHRFAGFNKGVIDSRDISFFLLSSFGFLYANITILLFRKWR